MNGYGDMSSGRDDVIRLAMWSGPRNISTALMRSFENRRDCWVWDEPFYASYLFHSGADHPMRSAILSAGITDWRTVIEQLLSKPPPPYSLFYQKHMTHHMIPTFDRHWIGHMRNAFLIRHPILVALSYHQRREHPRFEDLGFVEQAEIFDMVCDHLGSAPPVLDSTDLATDPPFFLKKLCIALAIECDESLLSSMVRWAPGARASDGVWGSHWYGSVRASVGFTSPRTALPDMSTVPASLHPVIARALPYYERLYALRLR